jgi:hypothetical protein
MEDVNMNPMPLKVIGGKACLRVRSLSRLSKDPRPERCPNTRRKEESKETREFRKVG